MNLTVLFDTIYRPHYTILINFYYTILINFYIYLQYF